MPHTTCGADRLNGAVARVKYVSLRLRLTIACRAEALLARQRNSCVSFLAAWSWKNYAFGIRKAELLPGAPNHALLNAAFHDIIV